MPLIIAVTVLVQAFFVWHVFKTGRPYWWALIILSFPLIGCAVYYAVEVFPGSREHRTARGAAKKILHAIDPHAEVKKKVQDLETCASIHNKVALAAECVREGLYEDAEKLYESCVSEGASDPAILFGLVEAQVGGNKFVGAGETLRRLLAAAPKFKEQECLLMAARIEEGLGHTEEALRAYERARAVYIGLEARYRYGVFLKKLGHMESAHDVLNDLLKHVKRYPPALESEQVWVSLARRDLAGG